MARTLAPTRAAVIHCLRPLLNLSMRFSPIGVFLLLALGCSGADDVLPPLRPWTGASEAVIAKANDPWITPSEKTGLTETPGYDATVAYLAKLDQASPLVALREFGRTAQGRVLQVAIAARNKAFTPEAARRTGRPVLLVQAGIHAGEIDGKDAGLMLLRDIAFRGKSSLLDHAILLFVPMFNADGHERSSESNRPNQRGPVRQGWRTTAQNLNLNRDYMKADAPEMQAMLTLINQWSPALYLDVHVSDGLDHQYDITFCYNGDGGDFTWSPHIARWLNDAYRPTVESALKVAGHIPGRYFDTDGPVDPATGLVSGTGDPRYSHGYGDLRHLPAVLVENHSLKPYRQRVLATYVLIEASLKLLGSHGRELRKAITADTDARPAVVPINLRPASSPEATVEYLGMAHELFTSPASGRSEVRWLDHPKQFASIPVTLKRAALQLRRPTAYWVPATKPDIIARLRLHGIQMETLPAARTLTLEMYRLVNPRAQPYSGFHPFEGRHPVRAEVKAEIRQERFPAGSVRVLTDQPLGDLGVALLEPVCSDSFLAWGFFPEIQQRTEYIEGYVIAPLAEQMLARDPRLKTEFEAKLQADAQFAANPSARLRWFYERSPYYDDRYLLYPVGIERDGTSVK